MSFQNMFGWFGLNCHVVRVVGWDFSGFSGSSYSGCRGLSKSIWFLWLKHHKLGIG